MRRRRREFEREEVALQDLETWCISWSQTEYALVGLVFLAGCWLKGSINGALHYLLPHSLAGKCRVALLRVLVPPEEV